MKWPWISRQAHMREVAKMAEAYRWERDEALAKARKAEDKLQRMVDQFGNGRLLQNHFPDLSKDRHQIIITLDVHPYLSVVCDEEIQKLAQRITLTLLGYKNHDYRPDMRDPHPETRLLRA